MKKFYSFVLMAMMLLVGTNAWANYPAGWLQQQFDNIQADGQTHTIVMGDDIILTDPVYLGTATVDEDRKSIILDMHGHNITMNATTWLENHSGVFCSVFNITHGELLIRNEDKSNTSLIQMIGVASGNYNNIFNVVGSYRSNRWVKNGNQYDTIPVDKTQLTHAKNTRDADGGWFTHLEIGDGVKLYAANEVYGSGISIDGYYTNTRGLISSSNQVNKESIFPNSALSPSAGNTCLFEREDAPQYNTAILKGGASGVAYGVRVDVYGDIEFATGATAGKSYGIKLNGGLRSSLRSGEVFHNQNLWYIDEAYARTYGATAAPTTNTTKTFTISEEVYQNHRNDTVDAPFVYIHKTAHIIAASTLNEATAFYGSGYGKTLIEGACSGNSGANIKSGCVEIHDAVITCTATATSVYAAENGNNATGTGAVVVNSVDERAGGIEVTITGDSKVSTDYGYAIKETVTATDNETKVSSISIEGGTIQGGAATATSGGGAIIVSEETKKEVVIYGANLTGNNEVEVGGGTLTDLLPKNEQTSEPEGHVTPVLDPVTGKTTLVISAGTPPAPANDWADVLAAGEGANVNWEGLEDVCLGCVVADTTLILGELQINSGTGTASGERQQLTIKSGATLQVEHLIMNAYARIIVNAGGKLIVKGTQGIIAPKEETILLQNEADKPAVFVFRPEVTSNRHPKATVEFISKGFNNTATGTFGWQKFGVPTQTKELTDIIIEGNIPTAFGKFNYEAETPAWEIIGYLHHTPALNKADLDQSFEYYQMEHNTAAESTKVTFTGRLVGNDCPALDIRAHFWNGYANSYSAPISGAALLAQIPSPADKAYYLYEKDVVSEKFSWVAKSNLSKKDIQPMQPFLVRNPSDDAVVLDLNYNEAVYIPAITPAAAPARRDADDMTKVEFVVRGENGVDHVIVAQDDEFSAAFDNGYDVTKYMNDDVNMYVTADEKMAIYATDNLENTYVGLSTVKGGNYTITFANVQGEDLILIDHETGAQVAMANGNIYTFSAAANSVNDFRFEIVAAAKMPTAIENTEAVKSVKGIYTITGQYVGEINVWNSLPAGVYVVNGAKRVK